MLLLQMVVATYVYYSTDGINWNSGSLGNSMMYSVTYGNGKFVAVGMYGYNYYSTDAINWTSGTTTFGSSSATLYECYIC